MFVLIQKQYPENFAFLLLRIVELFTCKVCKSLKKQANFQHILLFLNAYKQVFYISRAYTSKSKSCFNMKSSTYYFHMKAKILADFQICISVPLMFLFQFKNLQQFLKHPLISRWTNYCSQILTKVHHEHLLLTLQALEIF